MLAVLHLLRVRPRAVRVITTLFWAQAVEHTRARTLLQRFRHPWTYALLLLICVLLSLALAQPQAARAPEARVHQVIVVDAGASMTARDTDAGRSRFDAARQAAMDEAERLSMDDRLAIIVADPRPRVIHRFGDPRPPASRRLEHTAPAEVPAATVAALKLAESLLHGRSNPRVSLITDRLMEAEVTTGGTSPIDVRVVRVGGPVSNAAILSAIFEPDAEHPLRGRFSVRVGYWGDEPRDVRLRIERGGGAPLLSETHTLTSGRTHDFVTSDLPADGDELIVHLRPDDAVPADNRTRFRLPWRAPIRVARNDSAPVALRLVVQTDPSFLLVDSGEDYDVDIVLGAAVEDDEQPAVVIPATGPALTEAQPIQVIGDAPLVRDLDFEGAVLGTGVSLGTLPDGAEPLLVSGGEVLAARLSTGRARRLYLALALPADDAEVCHRPAFAVFITRAFRWLANWDDDPVVLSPERTGDDPLWADRAGYGGEVLTMPGSRRGSDLSAPIPADSDTSAPVAVRWSWPAWFEVILYLAVACFLVEAVLHTRGRIS